MDEANYDEASYRVWWRIHLRAVRGESLDASERARYEAGKERVLQAERLESDIEKLRESRAMLQAMEAEQGRLHKRTHELDVEIAALEAVLDDGTRAKMIP